MTALIPVDCHILTSASRLERIEALRDRLPDVCRVLERMKRYFPSSIEAALRERDEDLIVESERLRDELAMADPVSVEGAVTQVVMAERDWLSGDPELQLRGLSMVARAASFLASRQEGRMGDDIAVPSLTLLPAEHSR